MKGYTTACKDCGHKRFWEGEDLGTTPETIEKFKGNAFRCEECGSGNTITELTKPITREDGEKALERLAERNGVGVEEMRGRIDKINKKVLEEISKEK